MYILSLLLFSVICNSAMYIYSYSYSTTLMTACIASMNICIYVRMYKYTTMLIVYAYIHTYIPMYVYLANDY